MNQVWGWLGETKHKEMWIRGGFPGSTVVKNPPANAGDAGSIPGSGRFPGVGNGNPLQYPCLENSISRGPLADYSPRSCRVGCD